MPVIITSPAARGHIDMIEDLECVEKSGVIRSLKRRIRVTQLQWNTTEGEGYKTLLYALEPDIVPKKYTGLDGEGFEMLILVGRHFKMAENDPATVDIFLDYVHVLDSDCQPIGAIEALDIPAGRVVYGKMKSSLQQVTTNLYIAEEVDEDGNVVAEFPDTPIVVVYTFPDGSDSYFYLDPKVGPGQITLPAAEGGFAGKTVEQGGEVTISRPQRNYQFRGIVQTTDPSLFEQGILGKVNEVAILPRDFTEGAPTGNWLMQDVSYEALSPPLYIFTFELQENPDGWDPSVVFIDDRTKRPPPGTTAPIQADKAAFTAKEYYRVNFEEYLGCTFEITGD